MFTNPLDPKVGAFYIAVPPQFVSAGESPPVIGAVLIGFGLKLGLSTSS